jgi:DNA-binding NtrC family response regulator
LCQQKLLRVLNDGTYHRVGDPVETRSHFQVIAASTKDLDDAVEEGRFLLDLRTRISGIEFSLQPLRHRLTELPALISSYFQRTGTTVSREELVKIIRKSATFYWQGNIRQLIYCLTTHAALAHSDNKPIGADQMPFFKTMHAPGTRESSDDSGNEEANPITIQSYRHQASEICAEICENLISRGGDFVEAIKTIERHLLTAAMNSGKSVSAICEMLRLKRSTFESKCMKHQLVRD